MDEAEYCERVGIMRDGKLLAMDTPTNLKKSIIKGDVWEVYAQPLEVGLESLARVAGVQRVGLTGDHLRTISREVQPEALKAALQQSGVNVEKIERGEPTLEDVFLSLAKD
jgi:ABC-2 type transport system ATP-binding protein